jgi:fructuronate reductase
MHVIRRKAVAGEPVTDPLATRLLEIGRACQNRAATDVPAFLSLEAVFPRALVVEPRFLSALSRAYEKIAAGAVGMPS